MADAMQGKSGNIKKVMLIFPPTKIAEQSHKPCVPPLGVLYTAAVLRDAGYEVKILDATLEGYYEERKAKGGFTWYGLSFREIAERISDFKPDVVGISCIFSATFGAVRTISKICKHIGKDLDKEIITFTGGAHPSFLSEKCLKEVPALDYIVIGEGEYTIREILSRLNNGESLSDVDGVAFRDSGKIKVNPKTTFVENLDDLPLPARDLVSIEQYLSVNAPHSIISKATVNMSIMTSRGCPYNCVFCSSPIFWGRQYRLRSVEPVLDEIEMLVKTYGAKEIQFLDDNLTADKERARAIFQGIIDRELDIVWSAPNGMSVWTLDEDMLKLMKKSGCYSVTLAIETGDQDVMYHIIGKPLDLNHVRKVAKILKKLKLETHSFFLVGFPDETLEQIESTFKFAKSLDLDSATFQIPQPLPGSRLYEQCMETGLIKDNFDFENINYLVSSYDTKHMKGKALEKKIASEFLKYNMSLVYRHPIRFFNKFGKFIIKNPFYVARFVTTFGKKALQKDSIVKDVDKEVSK